MFRLPCSAVPRRSRLLPALLLAIGCGSGTDPDPPSACAGSFPIDLPVGGHEVIPPRGGGYGAHALCRGKRGGGVSGGGAPATRMQSVQRGQRVIRSACRSRGRGGLHRPGRSHLWREGNGAGALSPTRGECERALALNTVALHSVWSRGPPGWWCHQWRDPMDVQGVRLRRRRSVCLWRRPPPASSGPWSAVYLDQTVPPGGYTEVEIHSLGQLFDAHLYPIHTRGLRPLIPGHPRQRKRAAILLSDQANALSANCASTGQAIVGDLFGLDLTAAPGSQPGGSLQQGGA